VCFAVSLGWVVVIEALSQRKPVESAVLKFKAYAVLYAIQLPYTDTAQAAH